MSATCNENDNAAEHTRELYQAYLLGCEDECLPEPMTLEQFASKWRGEQRNRVAAHLYLKKLADDISEEWFNGQPRTNRKEDLAALILEKIKAPEVMR